MEDPSNELFAKILHMLIVAHFDEGELRHLCFSLGTDYEILPGEGKSNKARELVLYFKRRNRLYELANEIIKERPNIPFPQEVSDFLPNHDELDQVNKKNISIDIKGNVANSEIYNAEEINITRKSPVRCKDCFGTGFEHQSCHICNGTGQVKIFVGEEYQNPDGGLFTNIVSSLLREVELSNQANWRYIDCIKCNGKGRILLSDPDDFQTYTDSLFGNKPFGRRYKNPCPTCNGHGELHL